MGLDLEAHNLSKSYNGNPVLRHCSCHFEPGRTYSLLGPNGSGKSTLFRMLALLEEPDAGWVRYAENGAILAKDLNLRRRITLLLPGLGLFNTTVFKNAAYGLKIRGIKGAAGEERVNAVLDRVGLAHKRSQRALELSSGEAKRLALARAMVIEPEVLLLDEPTANIDPQNTAIIESIVSDMKEEGKATIVLITHDPAQAQRLGDQVLVMRDGRAVPS